MAKSGDRFQMPDGSVYAVLSSAADNGGAFVEMEFVLPSGCVSPPPHVHADLTEEYEVREASLEVMVGSEWTTLGPCWERWLGWAPTALRHDPLALVAP